VQSSIPNSLLPARVDIQIRFLKFLNLLLPSQDIDSHLPEPSDWEKFAAEEYEILVAEEQADEQDSFGTHYREDVDPLIEEELRNLAISSGMVGLGQREVEVKSDNFRKSPILSEMDSPDASAHRRLLT